jgi:Fe-S-cluster-containing hydrogenase component 2
MAALRKLVWIEHSRLRCWGCSECAWVFNPFGALTGKSLDESIRNFELQRDKEFTLHVCADHPRVKSQSTKHDVKQDWEKLYRGAIIESDRSKLLQRIEAAEAAILERSRNLSKSPANSGKEQEDITRAVHILSLLRAKAGD